MPPDKTTCLPVDIPRQAGAHVRRTREERGLTRAQLAVCAGVSERLLASLELGDAPGIRLDKLLSILHALGLSLAVLSTEGHPDRQEGPTASQNEKREGSRHSAVSNTTTVANGMGQNAHQRMEEKLVDSSEGLLSAYERALSNLICQGLDTEDGQR